MEDKQGNKTSYVSHQNCTVPTQDETYALQKVCHGDKLEEDQAIAEACHAKTEGGRNKSPLPLMIYLFIYK